MRILSPSLMHLFASFFINELLKLTNNQRKRSHHNLLLNYSIKISALSPSVFKTTYYIFHYKLCYWTSLCLFSIVSPALLIWSWSGSARGCRHWQLALSWSQPKLQTSRREMIHLRTKRLTHHQNEQNRACDRCIASVVQTEVRALYCQLCLCVCEELNLALRTDTRRTKSQTPFKMVKVCLSVSKWIQEEFKSDE